MDLHTANVFNIERFATEDGPGIRTVVFLKGCSLRCKWCANPESQSAHPEIMFSERLCVNCGKCLRDCPQEAITLKEGFGYISSMTKCTLCMKCIDNCYADARSVMGKDYTIEELLDEVLRDKQYYQMSGGGVTFSGGEPFLQSEVIEEAGGSLKPYGITTLVETCGHVPLEKIKQSIEQVEYIYFDIKQMDPIKHKQLTGHDNSLILSNLDWLCKNFKGELSVRYPYIPTCNDGIDDIKDFLSFISVQKNVSQVVFLPYHRLGLPKYKGLGREYVMGDMKSLKKKELFFLRDLAADYGLEITIQ
jgi:pyruvate formate lyase activating enzyme